MLIVCVHYPLDPQMSKECIARNEHEFDQVSELAIPFTGSSQTFLKAVERMYILGNITGSEMRKLKEKFDKDRHDALMKKAELLSERMDRAHLFTSSGWPAAVVKAPRDIPSN